MPIYWSALLFAVCANIFANVAFKLAMREFPGTLDFRAVVTLAATPWIWAGLASGILLLGSYLIAIRGIDLGIAYPAVTGLAMAGIVIAGSVLFSETLTVQKITGIGFVFVGILILSHASQA